jgi:hypothetical protein
MLVVVSGAGELAPLLKRKLKKSPRDKMVRPEQVKTK